MSDLQRVGPVFGGVGTAPPFTAGITGAQRVGDAHGRYMDAAMSGRVYQLSAAAAAPTAYVGAAGGTPLLAVHNPTGSNKYIALLAVTAALRAAGSAAGQTGLNVWSGPSVAPTGTRTNPTNVLSLAASGSASLAFVNTALTGSTALTLAMGLFTYYWATAAGAIAAPAFFDIGGLIILAPGNQLAVGLTVVPTSTTLDVSLFYEELPMLVTV